MSSRQNSVIQGAVAGCLATIPMTAAMAALFRRLPVRHWYSPPPHQVAMEIAEVTGVKKHLEPHERLALTTLSHFGYGTAMGAIYGAAAPDVPMRPAARGAAFGLAVWGASYLGWLPAADFRAGAHRQSLERNVMMIAAHLVFGASLGILHDRLTRPRKPQRNPPSRVASPVEH